MARKPVLCEEVGARALRNQTGGGRVGGFSLPVGEIFLATKNIAAQEAAVTGLSESQQPEPF